MISYQHYTNSAGAASKDKENKEMMESLLKEWSVGECIYVFHFIVMYSCAVNVVTTWYCALICEFCGETSAIHFYI